MFGAAIYDTVVRQLSIMCVVQQQPTSKLALQSPSFDAKCREVVPVGVEAFDFVNAEKRLFGLTENIAATSKESIELDERIDEGFVYEHRLSVGCAGALLAYLSKTNNGQLSTPITVKPVQL
ncbi:hypothetical protein H4S03_004658 [Coemansia sp. S3946]|nr:hypothetical protein H4S03_004658 [Coemansia sp. S3946]